MNIVAMMERVFRAIYRERVYWATVVSVSGNTVTITRSGQETYEELASADGIAAGLTNGDLVKVQRVGGIDVVEYAIST